MPKLISKFRTLRGCCGYSLRTSCIVIGLTMIFVIITGAVLTPSLLNYPEYYITFTLTVLVNILLIIAAILNNKSLLLIWFAYGFEFMLGFPLRQESISSYYRPLYKDVTSEYSMVILVLEFLVLKGFILFSLRMVFSYYMLLRDEEAISGMQNYKLIVNLENNILNNFSYI